MKYTLTLLMAILGLMATTLQAQSWFMQIPADENGRLNYFETKQYVEKFREDNPYTPLKGEKQFLRSKFFLEGRVLEDGYLPSGIYWEESKRVISERTQYRAQQPPWNYIGPDNSTVGLTTGEVGGSGRIDCITFHPTDPDIFYVGAPSGGLWRTTDGGQTWEPLTDNLPTLGISDVDLHPQDPNTIFICTGTRDVWWETFSVGILKSTDGGDTWEETGLQYSLQQNRAVHELWINPQDPQIMLAATSLGVFRTTDGGDVWDRIVSGNFMDLAQKEGDPSVIFATNFNVYYCGAKVYRSSDFGETFEILDTGIPQAQVNRITVATTPADPDVIYALCSNCGDNGFYGLYRSNDGGDSWSETPNSNNINILGWEPDGMDPGGQGYFTLAISVAPDNPDKIHAGGVNIWESDDGGDIWTLHAQYYGAGAQYVHADIHTLTYHPLNQSHFNTNDGGIYKYNETSGDWYNISDGLHIMQFYRLGVFAQNENILLGSPQDNGTVLFTEAPVQHELFLAEACDNYFDYNHPDTMYYGGYGAGLNRTYNGGYNYTEITPPGESNLRFNPPTVMHPVDAATIYCGYKDAWVSHNRGSSWTNLTNGLTNYTDLQSLEVAPSDPDYIYIATYNRIWRTTDGGTSWEDIRPGLPGGNPMSDIAISTSDPNHIWVTFQGWSSGQKVYTSLDAGDNWTNVSENLPNIPANCVTYEPGSDDAVYVGTDVGIYYTNSNLSEWVDYSQELPNVMVNELEIHVPSGKILAATYGRGMWWNYLADPTTVGIRETCSKELVVYPNPAYAELHIEWIPPHPGIYHVSLNNLHGQTILKRKIRSAGMEIHETLDVSVLPSGIYMVQIVGSDVKEARKVVVGR